MSISEFRLSSVQKDELSCRMQSFSSSPIGMISQHGPYFVVVVTAAKLLLVSYMHSIAKVRVLAHRLTLHLNFTFT